MSAIKGLNPADLQANLESIDQQPKKVAQVESAPLPPKKPSISVKVGEPSRMSASERFVLLCRGDWKSARDHKGDPFPSQSEADEAFCSIVAKQCKGDPAKIATLLALSGLNRDKWNREDYRNRTITAALKNFKLLKQGYDGDGSDWRQYFPADADCGEEPDETPLVERFMYEDTLNMVTGGVGHLKTWACLSLARSLVYGEPVFEHYRVPKAIPILYLCPDMSRKKLRKRMKMFGLDAASLKAAGIPDDMFRFRTFKEGDVIPLTDPRTIEAAKGRVVILDTAGYFADIKDENQAAEFKKLSVPCRQLIAAGCRAVIMVHHSTKVAIEHDVMTLESFVKGSYAIAGLLDDCFGFLIVDEKQGQLYVKCIKPRSFEEKFAFVLSYRDKTRVSLLSQGKMKMLIEPSDCLELKTIKDAIRGNPKAAETKRKEELAAKCKREGLSHRQTKLKFEEAGLKISNDKLAELRKAEF